MSFLTGDKAVLALTHPVVTVRKNHVYNKKLRQESITLLQDAPKVWCKVLPRSNLKDRFVVIERTARDHSRKHIVANPHSVRAWLKFMLKYHKEFVRMKREGELQLSEEALRALESQSELEEVVDDVDDEESADVEREESGIQQPEMESGFSSADVYSLDKYPMLYLKAKEFLKIKHVDNFHNNFYIGS